VCVANCWKSFDKTHLTVYRYPMTVRPGARYLRYLHSNLAHTSANTARVIAGAAFYIPSARSCKIVGKSATSRASFIIPGKKTAMVKVEVDELPKRHEQLYQTIAG